MFRPIPMMRVSLVVLARDERKVLMYLGQQGVLQLARSQVEPDTACRDHHEKLAHCADLLARCGKLRQALDCPTCRLLKNKQSPQDGSAGTPRPTENQEISQGRAKPPAEPRLFQQADRDAAAGHFETATELITQLETQATDLLSSRQRLLARKNELSSLCERAAKYRDLDLPLDRLDRSSFLHFVIGSLPPGNLESLQDKLGATVAVMPSPGIGGQQPVIIMTTPQRRAALAPLLDELGFHPESLPATGGLNADALYAQSFNGQKQVTAEFTQVEEKLLSLSITAAESLTVIEDVVNLERRLLEASQTFARTESSILLNGWMPEPEAPSVVAGVKSLTQGHCVAETTVPDPASAEPVPTLLRPSRWARPFSRLVAAYGLPEYWELEPTLFVAISYILMFGMMFGDAGQGAILALGGLAALRLGRSATIQDAGLLLLLGGLSSIVFGILYGSYFGIPALKSLALWRDPLEGDPLHLMLAAVGMGVVVISLGLALNIINRFRQDDALGGILGRFGIAGLIFYWGALILLAKSATIRSHGLMAAALILFLALPMAGWMLKGPIERALRRNLATDDGNLDTTARVAPRPPENLDREGRVPPRPDVISEFFESIIGAFEGALMYLANTTSFVRLAAYAMSHAALLMAVFTVADTVKHSGPMGGAWGVVVVILGNAVAIILEGTIAAVQALRLEYYEFFGKFFSGTGQPFTPFRLT